MDGGDEGKVDHGLIVEATGEVPIGLVAQLLLPEPDSNQPAMDTEWQDMLENHLNRKVVAWTRKGVTIHEAVKMAHRG